MHNLVKLCKLQMKELRTMSNIHHKLQGRRKICIPREHSNSGQAVRSFMVAEYSTAERQGLDGQLLYKQGSQAASFQSSPML